MAEKTAVFELENVTKTYKNEGKEFTALKSVNLDIFEGEIFGIIGMSGAGKSTLVRTLNRLEDVSEGDVRFYGESLGKLKSRELRKVRQSISMIFQGFNLLMQKTVLENVMIPLRIARVSRAERKKKALEMLKVVGLEDKKKSFPAQLSGGQRQRVAIARALTNDPKVLLCDEATSALDPKITEEILDLLQEINKTRGLTVIIITHEMSVVEKICDRVAIIDEGNLVEVGEVQEVFTNPKSDAAKRLVLPRDEEFEKKLIESELELEIESELESRAEVNEYEPSSKDSRIIRIAFDGQAAGRPFISELVEDTGEKVNILSANTRSVGGTAYGQMVLELPKGKEHQDIVLDYFKKNGLSVIAV